MTAKYAITPKNKAAVSQRAKDFLKETKINRGKRIQG
jgi:hypothetical protein